MGRFTLNNAIPAKDLNAKQPTAIMNSYKTCCVTMNEVLFSKNPDK